MSDLCFTGKEVLSKFRLDNKVAIVTGSGHGIGEGITLGLAGAGAHVVVAALHSDSAEATATKVKALGRRALPIGIDVTNSLQVQGMIDKTLKEFGRIDILVNNVGGPTGNRMSPLDIPDDVWDEVIKFNLKSTFLCSKFAGRVMRDQKSGNIINIASATVERPFPEMIAYGVSKAGVINFTQTLSVCLAPYNIRVNCISPGPTHTPSSSGAGTVKQRAESADIPLERIAYPEDIAFAAIYLASEASDFITGIVVEVTGGPHMGRMALKRAEEVWKRTASARQR